jgi:hypothetical protein
VTRGKLIGLEFHIQPDRTTARLTATAPERTNFVIFVQVCITIDLVYKHLKKYCGISLDAK